MSKLIPICAAALALSAAIPAAAAPHTLDPLAFQSFLVNWTPADRPLCAVLRDAKAWATLMHPAPVMGGRRPFGPDAAFWSHHAVLLFARVVPSGDPRAVFQVESIRTEGGVLSVRLRASPPPPASSQVKAWTGIVVVPPVPRRIRFIENGNPVCNLDLRAGFVTPSLPH